MSHHTAAWFGLVAFAAATFAQPAGAQTLLFEGARVIAGDGGAALENATILAERGTITRIARSGEITAPAGATRIDLAGKTVMPAIIATHVHPGFQSGLTYLAENFKRETILDDLNHALYFGVSTVMRYLRFQNGFVDENGPGADFTRPLSNRAEISFDGNAQLFSQVVPLSLRMARTGYADGAVDLSGAARAYRVGAIREQPLRLRRLGEQSRDIE